MLNSLAIKNYRNLKDLKIDSLGRVNLFIGKNNIGKSSLLEAVAIYAAKGDVRFIYDLLEHRGEEGKRPDDLKEATEANSKMFSSLFTDRIRGFEKNDLISIGPIESNPSGEKGPSSDSVIMRFYKFIEEREEDNKGHIIVIQSHVPAHATDKEFANLKEGFEIKIGSRVIIPPLEEPQPLRWPRFIDYDETILQLIRIGDIAPEINGKLYDKIVLTEKENYVIEALQMIEPAVERMAFTEGFTKERSAVVKLSGIPNVLPLRSMGDGINRVLTIILALVNSENGYLLIDEFESGLHHSIQADLWKIIFKLSKELNVQVFATTHSEDCIAGFGDSLNSPGNTLDGKLMRLENRKGAIRIVEYTPNEIRIATERHIETR